MEPAPTLVDRPPPRGRGWTPIWRAWLPLVLWMVAIYLVSDQPDIPSAPDGTWDWIIKKTLHATAYGILAWLWARALATVTRWPVGRMGLAGVWLLTVLYAVTDEWHQLQVPGRHGRAYDVWIDGAGALVALWVLQGRWFGRAGRSGSPK